MIKFSAYISLIVYVYNFNNILESAGNIKLHIEFKDI